MTIGAVTAPRGRSSRKARGAPRRLVGLGAAAFVAIALTFFGATLTKVTHGGWVPLAAAAVMFTVLTSRARARYVPRVDRAERLLVDSLGYRDDGITLITARYGYRDRQSLPEVVAAAAEQSLERSVDLDRAS